MLTGQRAVLGWCCLQHGLAFCYGGDWQCYTRVCLSGVGRGVGGLDAEGEMGKKTGVRKVGGRGKMGKWPVPITAIALPGSLIAWPVFRREANSSTDWLLPLID